MSIVMVVAPHPDDETLGCGGSLLRHIAEGDEVHWLIVTDMSIDDGFDIDLVARRQQQIEIVADMYGFKQVHNLKQTPANLDRVAKQTLITQIGKVIRDVAPQTLYLPFRGDVHSDHALVFDAVTACTKWFRYSSIQRVLCYETLSETDFSLDPGIIKFNPNIFINITNYLNKKVEIANIYQEEMDALPFPRSDDALKALAVIRGVASGCFAAESFMLLKEIKV